VFFNLLNLQSDQKTIDEALEKRLKKSEEQRQRKGAESATGSVSDMSGKSMEGAMAAKEAEPGTLKTTLAETPSVLKMTEKTGSLQNTDDINVNEKSFTKQGSI